MPASSRLDATPAAASIQATWPITSNSLVADQVSDFCQTDYKTSWARTFRLARFYEALDALTADVAYTYTDGLDKGLVLVTGGHYHSLSCGGRADGRRDAALLHHVGRRRCVHGGAHRPRAD